MHLNLIAEWEVETGDACVGGGAFEGGEYSRGADL